jgi:hypothetical protein
MWHGENGIEHAGSIRTFCLDGQMSRFQVGLFPVVLVMLYLKPYALLNGRMIRE